MTQAVTKHRRYVKSSSDHNNNKYWYITEYADTSIKVEYGRIGREPQVEEYAPGQKDFDKLCAKKEKGKSNGEPPYRLLDVLDAGSSSPADSKVMKNSKKLEDIAVEEIAKGDKKIETLVRYLVSQNIHGILSNTTMTYNDVTGLFSTPCGVVTQKNVDQARDLLAKMVPYVKKKTFTKPYVGILEEYLMLIPQEVKNLRKVEEVFPDDNSIGQQNSILDSLQASLDSINKAPVDSKLVAKSSTFGVTLSLNEDDAVFDQINRRFTGSMNRTHSSSSLKLKQVYTVDIVQMRTQFDTYGRPIGNIRHLWHGTRVANVLSILQKGLVIPPSSASYCTGRMYGDGIYFSDQSTKSLNYSNGYWGGGRDNNCFMFSCDVAMGKEYTPSGSFSGSSAPKGYDSTFAKAGRSGVMNNEMIVYDVRQCNLAYLCKFGN